MRQFLLPHRRYIDSDGQRHHRANLRVAATRFDSQRATIALALIAWLPRRWFAMKQGLGWH